jgi:class 3 adenylate cyclase
MTTPVPAPPLISNATPALLPPMGFWLASVGLSALEPTLRAQGIAEDILPSLTDAELADIGLTLGDRKRLRLALDTWLHAGRTSPSSGLTPGGDLRQLTILFCDLVDATAWCERLPPEWWRQVVLRYQHVVAEVVQTWGGRIAQYLGDGVLVYFGHPQALEDAALRATHAAWAMRQAVAAIDLQALLPAPAAGQAWPALDVRIGVDTGRVVVGDVGAGPHREHLALGDTPHIAARLQALAAPGEVLISEATRRLSAGHFVFGDHGTHPLKGVRLPRQVWRVQGPAVVPSHFQARTDGAVQAPLVGRGGALACLNQAWRDASLGQGRVLMLSGEAGMGKSRLVASWCAQTVKPVLLQCTALRSHVAFHPLLDGLQRSVRGPHPDGSFAVTAPDWPRLKHLVCEQLGLSADQARSLGELLGWPPEAGQAGTSMAHERQCEQAHALVDWVLAPARLAPMVIWLEDLHWADPATLQWLQHLVQRVRSLPVMLVCTHRPDVEPGAWAGELDHVALFRLEGLQPVDASTLVSAVVEAVADGSPGLPNGGHLLRSLWSPAWTQAVVARTDGVPLFLEELTRAWLEQLMARQTEQPDAPWPEPERHLASMGLPLTLRDTLSARLDRHPDARTLAQVGSVLGRDFDLHTLRAVAGLPDEACDNALAILQASGLAAPLAEGARWSFKHALVQDTAYDSLTAERRQGLHAAVLRVLSVSALAQPPDVLASHAWGAGLNEQAVGHWRAAGEQALARLALQEAQAHLSDALHALSSLPEGLTRDTLELPVQALRGAVHMLAQGWAAPEVAPAFARARDLADRTDAGEGLSWPLWGMAVCDLVRGDIRQAKQSGERLQAVARQGGQRRAHLVSDIVQVQLSYYSGDWAALPGWHQRLEDNYQDPQDRELIAYYTTDLRLVSRVHALHVAWLVGACEGVDELESRLQQLDAQAQDLQHAYSLAWMRAWGSMACLHAGEARHLHGRATSSLALARSHGFAYVAGMSEFQLGWCESELGDAQAGLQRMQRGLAAFEQTGAGIVKPCFLTVLAHSALKAGATGGSVLPWLQRAQALMTQGGETWYAAETWRVLALACSDPHLPDAPQARWALDQAEACARAQGAQRWLGLIEATRQSPVQALFNGRRPPLRWHRS